MVPGKTVVYLKNYSISPGPRLSSQGLFSAEEWLLNFVYPTYMKERQIMLDLDGVDGFSHGFIEEVIIGLVNKTGLSFKELLFSIDIRCNDEPDIISFIYGLEKKCMKV